MTEHIRLIDRPKHYLVALVEAQASRLREQDILLADRSDPEKRFHDQSATVLRLKEENGKLKHDLPDCVAAYLVDLEYGPSIIADVRQAVTSSISRLSTRG